MATATHEGARDTGGGGGGGGGGSLHDTAPADAETAAYAGVRLPLPYVDAIKAGEYLLPTPDKVTDPGITMKEDDAKYAHIRRSMASFAPAPDHAGTSASGRLTGHMHIGLWAQSVTGSTRDRSGL